MGCCSGSKIEKGSLDSKLSKIKPCDIPELDEVINKINPIVEFTESVREILIDKLDQTIIDSGACAHVNPSLAHCLLGIIYKGSVQLGSLKNLAPKIEINENGLDIKMGSVGSVDKKLLDCVEDLKNYFKGLMELEPKVEEVADKLKELSELPGDLEAAFDKVKETLESDPMKIISIGRTFAKAIQTAKHTLQVIPKIIDAIKHYILSIKEEAEKLSKAEGLKELEHETELAIKAKREHPAEILWHALKEKDRCKNDWKHGVTTWTEKLKDKQEIKEAANKDDE